MANNLCTKVLFILLFVACQKQRPSLSLEISADNNPINSFAEYFNPSIMASAPTATNQINCVGVLMGYREAPNKGNCTLSNGSIIGVGQLAGLIPFNANTGSRLLLNDVLIGKEVQSFAVGFQDSTNAGCVGIGPGFRPADYSYSEGYIIASRNFNTGVSGVIDMQAQLTTSTPYVSRCDASVIGKTTASLKNDLSSYWNFNDNSNVTDSHGSNNLIKSGTINNSNIGARQSLDFLGSGSGLEAASSTVFDLSTSSKQSISFWIYRSSSPNSKPLFHKVSGAPEYGWKIFFDAQTEPQLYVSLYESGNSNSYNLGGDCRFKTIGSGSEVNTWLHYVVMINMQSMYVKGFKNGAYCGASPSFSENSVSGSGIFNIAKIISGQEYSGLMDDVGIWSRELSLDEVQRLYNNGSGLDYSNF